jgi:hypothetical protein
MRNPILKLLTSPDPAIFVSDLQDEQLKLLFLFFVLFFCLLVFEAIFTSFFKDKKS